MSTVEEYENRRQVSAGGVSEEHARSYKVKKEPK